MKAYEGRIRYIDLLKGIGIILMVLGHMHYSYMFEKFVFGFHMPLFFCISGYLYKRPSSIKKYISKKVYSLLIPYFVFGLLYSFIVGALYGKDVFLSGLGGVLYKTTYDMPIESALWFLPAMFWVEVMYSTFDRLIVKRAFRILVLFVITVIGVYWTKLFHPLPFAINSAMSAVGFYSVGVWFRSSGEKRWDDIVNRSKPIWRIIIFISLFLCFSCIILKNEFVNIRTGEFGIAPIAYITACFFSLLLFSLAKGCNNNSLHFSSIEFIGRNSIVYLLTNHPALLISKKLLVKCGMTSGSWPEIILEFAFAMTIMSIGAIVILKTPIRQVVGFHKEG